MTAGKPMSRRLVPAVAAFAFCCAAPLRAADESSVINPRSRNNLDYAWFSEARFGMFVHFSLASLFGEDLGYQYLKKAPYREYETNVARFNPSRFSASQWVDVAEQAGCGSTARCTRRSTKRSSWFHLATGS